MRQLNISARPIASAADLITGPRNGGLEREGGEWKFVRRNGRRNCRLGNFPLIAGQTTKCSRGKRSESADRKKGKFLAERCTRGFGPFVRRLSSPEKCRMSISRASLFQSRSAETELPSAGRLRDDSARVPLEFFAISLRTAGRR